MYIACVFLVLAATAAYEYRWALFHAIMGLYRKLFPKATKPPNNTVTKTTIYKSDGSSVDLNCKVPLSLPGGTILVVDYWYEDYEYKHVYDSCTVEFPVYEDLEPFAMKHAVVSASIDGEDCASLINALGGPMGELSGVTTEYVKLINGGGKKLELMGYDFKARVYDLEQDQTIAY